MKIIGIGVDIVDNARFKKLVKIMIKHDIKLVENEIRIKQSYE